MSENTIVWLSVAVMVSTFVIFLAVVVDIWKTQRRTNRVLDGMCDCTEQE
jgi:hypothetical protein